MADKDVVYMVGWCPDCGRTVVVRHEEEWTCGCGHDLLNLTSCFSPVEVADAVALMETVKNDALREPDAIHRPTLAEEEARCEDDGDDGAPDIIKELFCELFRDDDCEGCPLCREDGDSTDSDELPGEGEVRMFMVSPTPFPVWGLEGCRPCPARRHRRTRHGGFLGCVEGGFGSSQRRARQR